MNSAGSVAGSRNRHVGSSPADAYEGTNIKAEWRKQLTAYVQWMNSQLKKKPGAHLVEDLRHDLRDGVALVDLIEMIAGEVLPNVHKTPSILVEMRENVDKVLQFMHSREIKMHNISTRDIVEGNLKATMRLILALAVHYKPSSVRHSSHCNRNSVAGIAQGASAALAEARRNATKAGHRYRRRQKENSTDHTDRRIVGEEHCGSGNRWTKVDGRAELEGASANSSPTSSHNTSPRASLYLSEPSSSIEGLLSVSKSTCRGSVMMTTSCESDNALGDSGFLEICDSLKETHDMLFQLHELLLEGDGSADGRLLPGSKHDCAHPTETIVLLKGRLLHSEEVAESLKSDLSRVRTDCMELQGTKAGLQQRLKEQEGSLSSLKSENMRLELEKEKLLSEIETLRKHLSGRDQVLADIKLSCMKQIEDKDSVIGDLRREILRRDHMINQLQEQANQGKVGSSFRSMNGGNAKLASDCMVREMSETNGLYQEERISVLTNCLSRLAENDRLGTQTSELKVVKDSLLQTRLQAPARDVPASKVDQLEDVIIKLLEKLHVNGSVSGAGLTSGSRHSNKKEPSYSRASAASAHGSTFSHTYSPATHCGRVGHSLMSRSLDAETNVTYYTHGSDKPLSCVIHKRLGDVRLGDFKSQIQDPGCYHFFFKVLDPEYGTVKEEVSGDDDVLPGWEGRIVAWLEVESGTAC